MVNNKPILASDAISEKEIVIAPVAKYQVIKARIVDLSGKKQT